MDQLDIQLAVERKVTRRSRPSIRAVQSNTPNLIEEKHLSTEVPRPQLELPSA